MLKLQAGKACLGKEKHHREKQKDKTLVEERTGDM